MKQHSEDSKGQPAAAMQDEMRASVDRLIANLVKKGEALEQQASQQRVEQLTASAVATLSAAPLPPIAEGDWPPGRLGEMAKLAYSSAIRPVPEVAIATVLAIMAGVAGKAWFVKKSGLNLYIILLARSAIGKEAIADVISMFVNSTSLLTPSVHGFYNFNDFASGPALVKGAMQNRSFLNVAGEFGRKLRRMAKDKDDGPMATLRTEMTKLYMKSGPNSIAGGINYSSEEKTVESIAGVAYSMIGESTPGGFLDCLTPNMMEDGFMSRFSVIEYTGERPPENPSPISQLPPDWQKWFASLVTHATQLVHSGGAPIERDPTAAKLLQEFNLECDAKINSYPDDESRRQMWNRAALKVQRVSGLQAVADNHAVPIIVPAHVEWAMALERRNMQSFENRLQNGDIGGDDKAREAKLFALMSDYIREAPKAGYKVPEHLRKKAVIERRYLQLRTGGLASFTEYKLGATPALDHSLASLVRSGYLQKLYPRDLESFGVNGECYHILRLR